MRNNSTIMLLKLTKSNIIILLLLIIISLPSIYYLFYSGFFVTDDGEWMVIRFSAFYQALRDGQFPVRFLGRLNNGYGYPVANFLYSGFMYLGVPIHILGFGFVSAIKIILGLSMVGSAIFTYLWLSRIFNKYSAFIGSLFYLYTPYHLFDLYKRGSVGEILALAIVPFILWQIERKSLFLISVGIALMILSHNTLALLFLPIIFIYFLISIRFSFFSICHAEFDTLKKLVRLLDISASKILKQVQDDIKCISPFLFGLGLSAFFWIPAIFELQYTRFYQTQVADFRNYFANIELIGLSSIIVLLISILFFYKVRPFKRSHLSEQLFIFFFIIAISGVFFSSELSSSLWNFLPSSFIQFPFRILSFLILAISFLSAYIIYHLKGNIKYFVSAVFIAALIFSSLSYLEPSGFFNKGEGFYATNEGTTTVQDEYLPKWVKEKPVEHFKEKVEIVNGQGEIGNLSYNSKKISFNINSQANSKIRMNTIYYPGWKAYVDGVQSSIQYDNNQGVMELSVPKGNHKINLSFSETSFRLIADIISILSFIMLIVIIRLRLPKVST